MPALHSAEERWANDQRYEAMCLLCVALTRAKRGLYVLLPVPPKPRKDDEGFASLANWVRRSTGGEVYESGDPAWFTSVPDWVVKTAQETVVEAG